MGRLFAKLFGKEEREVVELVVGDGLGRVPAELAGAEGSERTPREGKSPAGPAPTTKTSRVLRVVSCEL